jgi:hypothetical protein
MVIGVTPKSVKSTKTIAPEGFDVMARDPSGTCADGNVGVGFGYHDGVEGVSTGVGVRVVGPGKYPALYWDIRSLLPIARAGEHTKARITIILMMSGQVFIALPQTMLASD